ncbi:YchJ family protein [Thiomicrospira microaerophila]|uniref:YchJ family protein n=1 Tax=Thiomicrospira microaerophila TaxID=406020 RepID=UPI0005C9914A|nr:YchJ family metal-binding protein [Thiomicrospira microaerophila]
MLILKAKCPCGSGQDYSDCCKLIHTGKAKALTAEALMRSRFSAYYLGQQQPELASYLLNTWCPSTRPNSMELTDQPNWVRLKIWQTQAGQPNDKQGIVEFSAFYLDGLFQLEFREKSYFQRNPEGDWCYLRGDILKN